MGGPAKKNILILIILGVFIFAPKTLALEIAWPDSPAGTPITDTSTLPDLIKYIYEWAIALGGLAVFISLLIAGIQYLTSLGDPSSLKEAMDRMKSAVLGLILLLSSWLILNTINPDLTSFTTEPLDLSNIGTSTMGLSTSSLNTNPTYCEKIRVYYSGGTIDVEKGGAGTEGNCRKVSLQGKSIFRSEGYLDGRLNETCMGSLQFFTSEDCAKDMIATYPATSPNITLDQVVRGIKFF